MTADSTELTFVRCPSCRSLVPAMSTKCRMCGTSLDASTSKGDEQGKSQKPQGRVRQRTSTQPDSELVASAQKFRDESSEESHAYDESDVSEDDFVDPLSAYVEEVDAKEPEAGTPVKPMQEENAITNGGTSTNNPRPSQERYEAHKSEEKLADPTPKVIVESGYKKQNSPNNRGLSFGGKPQEDRSSQEPRHQQDRNDRRGDNRPQHEQRNQGNQDQQRNQSQQQNHKQYSSEQHKVSPQKNGKLCGWLVSFATNPLGSSIELREGKFFISGKQLKPTDLVVEHQSVSTPHAIASAGLDQGLSLHDLMSEKGVFLKRKGEQNYKKEDEQFIARSGDWVKFGDAEYMVVFLPK